MIAAATGLLVPLTDALLQEGINVAATLFALTALHPGLRDTAPTAVPPDAGLVERTGEHALVAMLSAYGLPVGSALPAGCTGISAEPGRCFCVLKLCLRSLRGGWDPDRASVVTYKGGSHVWYDSCEWYFSGNRRNR